MKPDRRVELDFTVQEAKTVAALLDFMVDIVECCGCEHSGEAVRELADRFLAGVEIAKVEMMLAEHRS